MESEARPVHPLLSIDRHATPSFEIAGAPSSADLSALAAFAGSRASRIARTHAMRRAPASITSWMFPESIPPMAYHGMSGFSEDTSRTYFRPDAFLPGFVGVSQTGPTAK